MNRNRQFSRQSQRPGGRVEEEDIRTGKEQIAFQYTQTQRQQPYQEQWPVHHLAGIRYTGAPTHVQGHSARVHPEDVPYSSDDVLPQEEQGEDFYPQRSHTSALRYANEQDGHTPLSQQAVKPRRSAQQPQQQQTRSIYPPVKPTRRLERASWVGKTLLFAGIGLFVMIVGWLLLSALGSWWQTQQEDWHYGRPRTYQIDAVVGHGDSPAHPSHFIAMNLNRHILVIEIAADDPTKSVIYLGPTLLGNGQELVPVTVSFEVGSKPGKPDMYLHIADQTIVFLNDGKKFVAATHP